MLRQDFHSVTRVNRYLAMLLVFLEYQLWSVRLIQIHVPRADAVSLQALPGMVANFPFSASGGGAPFSGQVRIPDQDLQQLVVPE